MQIRDMVHELMFSQNNYEDDLVLAIELYKSKIQEYQGLLKKAVTDLVDYKGHELGKSKTYTTDIRKYSINSTVTYKVNEELYVNGDIYIEPHFDPIVRKTKFEVNKELLKLAYTQSSLATRDGLKKLIQTQFGAPSVTIKA